MALNNLIMFKAAEEIKGWTPVTFASRVDAFNVAEFRDSLSIFAAQNSHLALDMREVHFINFEAIRHIHQVAIEMEEKGGELALIGPSEKLKRQVSLFASLDPIRVYSRSEWNSFSNSPEARA